MNIIYFILIVTSLTLSGCATQRQRGAINIVYKAIKNNDCSETNKFLTIAEETREVTAQLQSKISFLRAVCLEKEKKYDEALELYSEIIEQFPDTIYAKKSQNRIDDPSNLFFLKIIHREAPTYPIKALRQKIEGWVELDFVIQKDGTVKDVLVIGSEPDELFDQVSIEAIKKWKFDLVVINERLLREQKSRQKFEFRLDNRCWFLIFPYSCD